jgi:hypothetical protein
MSRGYGRMRSVGTDTIGGFRIMEKIHKKLTERSSVSTNSSELYKVNYQGTFGLALKPKPYIYKEEYL